VLCSFILYEGAKVFVLLKGFYRGDSEVLFGCFVERVQRVWAHGISWGNDGTLLFGFWVIIFYPLV
jgi:hypothetical protein